jgi:hypothetical protein
MNDVYQVVVSAVWVCHAADSELEARLFSMGANLWTTEQPHLMDCPFETLPHGALSANWMPRLIAGRGWVCVVDCSWVALPAASRKEAEYIGSALKQQFEANTTSMMLVLFAQLFPMHVLSVEFFVRHEYTSLEGETKESMTLIK